MFLTAILIGLALLIQSDISTATNSKANGFSTSIIYVKPENSSNTTCPGIPCGTLDDYANVSHSDNTKFMFLPGIHKLSRPFILQNLQFIKFIGLVDLSPELINTTQIHPQINCSNHSYAGFIFNNITSLTMGSLTIAYCGQPLLTTVYNTTLPAQASVAMKQVFTLTMYSVTVQNSRGYGLAAEGLYGNTNISNCIFQYNSGNGQLYVGGNVAIMYKNCPANYTESKNTISIMSSTLTYGYTSYYTTHPTIENKLQATGLVIDMSCTNLFVHIANVTLGNNQAHSNSSKGGNLYISFHSTSHHINNSVLIENSNIINGNSVIAGGAYIRYFLDPKSKSDHQLCQNTLTFRNTNFTGNSGSLKSGAMYILFIKGEIVNDCPRGQVTIEHCYFKRNQLYNTTTADSGVAINVNTFFINGVLSSSLPNYTVQIKESYFVHNALMSEYSQIHKGAVLYVGNRRREIFIVNSTFKDNAITAISVYRSNIVFQGEIKIKNNTGIDGGGLILCEASYIFLSQNTDITFENNTALRFGGAIYAEGQCLEYEPLCFYQIYQQEDDSHFITPNKAITNTSNINTSIKQWALQTIHVKMIYNKAGVAGSQIFGGSLDNCLVIVNGHKHTKGTVYEEIFNESLWKYNKKTDMSYVTSYPRYVCFCNLQNEPMTLCEMNTLHLEHEIFPGEPFTVSVVAVGQFDNPVPATIMAKSITTIYSTHSIQANCTSITFTINTDKSSATLTLLPNKGYVTNNRDPLMSPFTGEKPRFVSIRFKACPRGISFMNSTNTCNISKHMWEQGYRYNINEDNQTLSRPGGVWVGVHLDANASDHHYHDLIHFTFCPIDYCKETRSEIRVNETYFDGDSQCVDTREGRLCGACKPPYSSAIASDHCLKCDGLFEKSHVSLLALGYLAISLILIVFLIVFNITITDGTVNGFFFYVNIFQVNRNIFVRLYTHNTFFTDIIAWINLDIGLTACFYNDFDGYGRTLLEFFSPVLIWIIAVIIIFLCSKCKRIAALVGANAVKLLATIFLVSYTKIVQAGASVFSCTTINKNHFWLRDANVECWKGKHIALVVIGALFGIFIAMYTLLLLCVQPLQRYSHHSPLRWVARLKPFIDAYTCPHVIKEKYRFWMGLLLLFRVVCVVLITLSTHSNQSVPKSGITIFTCSLILTLAWSFGGVYKSWWLNVINASFYFNLVSLCILTWYNMNWYDAAIKEKAKQLAHHNQFATTQASTIIAVISFFLIVVYHICKRLQEVGVSSYFVTRLGNTRLWQILRRTQLWQTLYSRYQGWRERRYQRIPQQDESEEDDDELDYDRDQDRELQESFENENEEDELNHNHEISIDTESEAGEAENTHHQANHQNENDSELLHTYTY